MARCSRSAALAAAALALAACYAPAIDDGLPCSETLACPSGQRCDTSSDPPICRAGGAPPDADAGIDGSPTADGDRDGVVDADDNCPAIANADQRDRDGDQRGDRCDRCPRQVDPMQSDGDADGIGDACDPWPTLQTQVLAYEEFDVPLAPPWVPAADALYQDDFLVPQPTAPYATWAARYPLPSTPSRVAIEVGVALGADDQMYPYPSAKAFIDATFEQDGTVSNVECGAVRIPTGQFELSMDDVNHDQYMNLGTAPLPAPATARLRLTRSRGVSSSTVTCAADAGSGPVEMPPNGTAIVGANVGLFIDHWRGRFDYVVIYTAP